MQQINISPNSLIKTVPIDISHSGEDVIIGSILQQGSFIKSNNMGLEAIELLNQRISLALTEDILSKKYKQNVSIKGLIEILFDANLISSIDDQQINGEPQIQVRSESKWKRLINTFFCRSAYWIYTFLFITAIMLSVHRMKDFQSVLSSVGLFILQNPILSIVISWLLVIKHEWFHYIAALSLGLPAKIKIGTRFIFIVMETRSDAIYLHKKRKRYRFYLAGMLGDMVFVAAFINLKSMLTLLNINVSPQLIDLCILQTVIGIIFQLNIFLKTDLYFVLADLLNKDNLYTDSGIMIKNFIGGAWRIKHIKNDMIVISYAIGRLLNYLIVFLSLIFGVYTLFKLFPEIRNISLTLDWSIIYFLGLCNAVLLLGVKIYNRKKLPKMKIVFNLNR